MKHAIMAFLLLGLSATAVSGGQLGEPGKWLFRPSDNGTDTRVFQPVRADAEKVEIDFTDQSNADNYLHIDIGRFDLAQYLPGGYLEIDAEIDRPVLRLSATAAVPSRFWPTRLILAGEAPMKAGRHTYRIYLDILPERIAKDPDYHLFLFLHDMGGESRGKANLIIHGTRLAATAPDWEQQKNDCYRVQYNWRNFPELGKSYRGKYDLLVPAAEVEANPFIRSISLNGEYEKTFIGDITWKYDQLLDYTLAGPGVKLPGAGTVAVPEPERPDQPGGYFWYKRSFRFESTPDGKTFLQFKDLADTAEIFLNGQWVGTQSNARRRNDWTLKNGSRQSNTWGKPAREVMKFQHFERCGIPFPFDENAIPDDEVLLLPIMTGEYPWNYVYDVTGLVKNGENTLAVRLYNNPVRGYWIYKNGESRTHRGIAGIFGDVNLYSEAAAGFAAVGSPIAGTVNANGVAEWRFTGKALPGTANVVLSGHGLRFETAPAKDGSFAVAAGLPANFERYRFTLTALNKDNRAFDARNVEFNGTVVEFRDDKLYLNGDRFEIRGLNGDAGIEWENDRTQTRRRWLSRLAAFKNLGFNALRMEGVTPEQLEDALAAGIMIMPVYAPGSCNTSEVALGNLDKPDLDFLTDPHKEMALQFAGFPNVLFWNSGNENHPTPGYNDKGHMERFLEAARDSLRKFDPARRPVTYANLDTFGTYWFFTAGQDVVGYNSYQFIPEFKKTVAGMYAEVKKPIVFCEWGFTENETNGTKYRKNDIGKWENEMREKLALMRQAPGVVGGFLYAHHGEMDDVRGREFLQEIMASFKLSRENDTIKFENQDIAPLREVGIRLVSPDDVIASEWVAELKPGRSMRLPYPEAARKNSAELRLEIEFETHRGLRHRYTRMVERIK